MKAFGATDNVAKPSSLHANTRLKTWVKDDVVILAELKIASSEAGLLVNT